MLRIFEMELVHTRRISLFACRRRWVEAIPPLLLTSSKTVHRPLVVVRRKAEAVCTLGVVLDRNTTHTEKYGQPLYLQIVCSNTCKSNTNRQATQPPCLTPPSHVCWISTSPPHGQPGTDPRCQTITETTMTRTKTEPSTTKIGVWCRVSPSNRISRLGRSSRSREKQVELPSPRVQPSAPTLPLRRVRRDFRFRPHPKSNSEVGRHPITTKATSSRDANLLQLRKRRRTALCPSHAGRPIIKHHCFHHRPTTTTSWKVRTKFPSAHRILQNAAFHGTGSGGHEEEVSQGAKQRAGIDGRRSFCCTNYTNRCETAG